MTEKPLQSKVAEAIGVSETSVYLWETGRHKPSLRSVPRIIEFLGYDPSPKPASLGDRIRAYRRSNGLPRKELAAALGLDPQTLLRLESGNRRVMGKTLDRLNAYFGSAIDTRGGRKSQ